MRYLAGRALGIGAAVVCVALVTAGAAVAQDQSTSASQTAGLVIGMVARCVTGVEQPAVNVAVGIDGGSATLARTDSGGQFAIALPPGQYTIVATAVDGTASRQYVPVEAGSALDIGIIDIGGGIAGCGPDEDISAPVLPTFTPVPAAQPTVAPTVGATAAVTPVPQDTPGPEPDATQTPDG